jgi:hypothetical protein
MNYKTIFMRSDFLAEMSVKSAVIWKVTPCVSDCI